MQGVVQDVRGMILLVLVPQVAHPINRRFARLRFSSCVVVLPESQGRVLS